ncbi:unnamed protein product [Ectocarpus sp. 12 AP-2014]
MGSIHQDCDCECDWCDDLGCKRWSVMCQDLSKFSDALACEKYMEHYAFSQVAAPSPQDVHGYTSSGRAVDRDGLHREVQA